MSHINSHIEHFISVFYFNISRKSDDNDVVEMGYQLQELIQNLKFKLKYSTSLKKTQKLYSYIRLMFKLMMHTRDISQGKGERKMTYMMICTWFKYYPILVVAAIKIMLGSNGVGRYSIGCWRDVKHLCTFAEKMGINGLVESVLFIAHTEMARDFRLFSSVMGSNISNIAKWLPRESSSEFSWIFKRLAVMWSEEFTPAILITPVTMMQRERALKLCNKNYRIALSKMNCALDEQSHIDITTYSKLNYIVPKRCSNFVNLRSFHKRIGYKYDDYYASIKCNSALPVYHYVKKSIELISGIDTISINYLNHQWNKFVDKHTFDIENVIPLIDVSRSMTSFNSLALHSAIGIGTLIYEKCTTPSGIIIVDDIPSFIEPGNTISETVTKIIHSNSHGTEPDFISAFKLVAESAVNTGMSPFQVSRLTFVILSNMEFIQDNKYQHFHTNISNIFYDAGLHSEYRTPFPPPNIVLWNLSCTNIPRDKIPIDINQYILFSGFSTNSIRYICNDTDYTNGPFSTIVKILNSDRYNDIDILLRKMMI